MHWTYIPGEFNLFLATDFKYEEAAEKENHHEKDSYRNRRIPRHWTHHRPSPRSRRDSASVVNYAGNVAKAEEVVNEITGAGGRAIALQADVANPEDVKQLFEKTLKAFGQIDVCRQQRGHHATLAHSQR